ncbi:MAG: hypothetical protein QXN22_03910 [Thermofilaceae archaeon]
MRVSYALQKLPSGGRELKGETDHGIVVGSARGCAGESEKG